VSIAGDIKLTNVSNFLNGSDVRTTFRKPSWLLQTIYAPFSSQLGSASTLSHSTMSTIMLSSPFEGRELPLLVQQQDVDAIMAAHPVPAFVEDRLIGMPVPVGTFDGESVLVHERAVAFARHLKEVHTDTVVLPSTGCQRKSFTQRAQQKLEEKTPYKVRPT
jgi:hypothetical protein